MILLSAIFLLAVSAVLFHFLQFPKLSRSCLVLVASLTWSFGSSPLPNKMLAALQVFPKLNPQGWGGKNIIVVLGFGTVRWLDPQTVSTHPLGSSRVMEAIRLYKVCQEQKATCHILFSGGDPAGNLISEAEVMQNEAVQLGVSLSDTFVEGNSRNTFENAKFSAAHLQNAKQEKYDNVILVTSGTHLARAALYFSNFSVRVVPAPSDHLKAIPSILPMAANLFASDLILHEVIGVLRFQFYNRMGWNKKTDQENQ